MMRIAMVVAVTLSLVTGRLEAQSSLEATCGDPQVQQLGAEAACYAAVQAALAGQPALGLVLAGGNPTFGTSGGTGLRLGTIPRSSGSLRLNLVGVRLPGILTDDPGPVGDLNDRFGVPVPALLGDVSIALTEGASPAPGVGGIGAISLLASLSYLPFRMLGVDGFENAPDFGWGIGGRIHLLNESFIAPGVSGSLIRRRLDTIQFGNICPPGLSQTTTPSTDAVTLAGVCTTDGDSGEFRLDLTDWSGRLVATKHLLGFGLSAGLGYDRYASELGFGFRGPESAGGSGITPAYRVAREDLESERWTLFGSASYTLLVGTLGVEAGWQQGDAPINGYRDLDTDFDPESGIWFASLGARLSL